MQELTAGHSDEERARYRVVRMDTCADVPGLILSASELTGLCVLRDAAGTSHEYVFGPNGLRILPR